MKWSITLIIVALCIAFVLPLGKTKESEALNYSDSNYSITQHDIVGLTDKFMELLVQDTDMYYQVKGYPNKASLVDVFEEITTEEVAKAYVDYYYYEENGGLYINPTETPPWFNKQNDYDVVQLEQNKFLVKQNNQSELYGNYKIEIEFTLVGQEWKITNIKHL